VFHCKRISILSLALVLHSINAMEQEEIKSSWDGSYEKCCLCYGCYCGGLALSTYGLIKMTSCALYDSYKEDERFPGNGRAVIGLVAIFSACLGIRGEVDHSCLCGKCRKVLPRVSYQIDVPSGVIMLGEGIKED